MKKIIFLESDFNLSIPESVIFEKPFRFIKYPWQRVLTILYYFLKLGCEKRDSIIIIPWGLFWIAAIWNKLKVKKFSIISLTCDTFLGKKTIQYRNSNIINIIKYALARMTYKEPIAYIYCSKVIRDELIGFGVSEHKLHSRYQEWVRDTDRRDRYLKYQPTLEKNHFLFIGHCYNMLQKRLDILIKSYIVVFEERDNPEIKLQVIGGGWDTFFGKERIEELRKYNIHFLGYTYDIDSYIQNSTFYVHPGEYEGFGVAVLEGMTAGLIPLVSDTTGASEVVELVDPHLVIELSHDAFTSGLNRLLDMGLIDRKKISDKSRKASLLFSKETALSQLKTGLQKILNDI